MIENVDNECRDGSTMISKTGPYGGCIGTS